MDKIFLDKVINQIVSETILDYGDKVIKTPFSRWYGFSFTYLSSLPYLIYPFVSDSPFTKHCRDVYSLNGQETEYVWKVYRDDITYKIERGG
tara:strand:+ start:224 stop:499 length:276 start_codon:yes stop_codon:yes gene_type:complete